MRGSADDEVTLVASVALLYRRRRRRRRGGAVARRLFHLLPLAVAEGERGDEHGVELRQLVRLPLEHRAHLRIVERGDAEHVAEVGDDDASPDVACEVAAEGIRGDAHNGRVALRGADRVQAVREKRRLADAQLAGDQDNLAAGARVASKGGGVRRRA